MATPRTDARAPTPRWFGLLLLSVVLGTFVLILLGGYVKALGAGLACPEWPSCEGGTLTTTQTDKGYSQQQVAAEVVHRAVASIVGVLVLLCAAASWRLRDVRPAVRTPILLSLPVLLIQIGLGGWTVTGGLQPLVVTAHLGMATIFFTLWVIAAVVTLDPRVRHPSEAVVS